MAIYYVDPLNGSDANAGTSLPLAWATTQRAADTAVAGDEVRLCATATEQPSAQVDFDTNAGTTTASIRFIGCDASGNPLAPGSYYTISGASMSAPDDILYIYVDRVRFEHIRLTGGPRHGAIQKTGDGADFINCRFDNNAGHGFYSESVSSHVICLACEVDNNTQSGFHMNSSGRGPFELVACSIHDNGNYGAWFSEEGANTGAFGCLIYDNSSHGVQLDDGSVQRCTIYNNGGDGVYVRTTHPNPQTVALNSIVANGGYGIRVETAGALSNVVIDYNHFYNNVSGETNAAATPGGSNQSGDPKFASTANGSEDFTPASDSPLVGNGPGGRHLGALPPATGGLGGGAIIVPQALGLGMIGS